MGKPRHIYLQGSSLLYTLMIGLVISGLISGYLLLQVNAKGLAKRLEISDRLERSLQSGMAQYLSRFAPQAPPFEGPVFEAGRDSIALQWEAWGLLGLVQAKASYGAFSLSRAALVGASLPPDRRYSLFLADQGQPLTLAGAVRMQGPLILPSRGYRTGRIGRSGSIQRIDISKQVQSSKGKQKALSPAFLPELSPYFEQVKALGGKGSGIWRGESWQMPWDTAAMEIRMPGDVVLRDLDLAGKIRLIAGGKVRIESSTEFAHLTVYAREIEIASRTEGFGQFFATEGIYLEPEVRLSYPSLLFLQAEAGADYRMEIGEGSEVEGAIIAYQAGRPSPNQTQGMVRIGPGSLIKGLIHVPDRLELQGQVWGSVTAGRFWVQMPQGSYQNHLQNAEIDFPELSDRFTAPLLFSQSFELIEWL